MLSAEENKPFVEIIKTSTSGRIKSAWTNNVQGIVSLNSNQTVIIQKEHLFNFSENKFLTKKFSLKNTPRTVTSQNIPPMMLDQEFDHFCDGDYKDDHLYIPIEGPSPFILFKYHRKNLQLVGLAEIPKLHTPWVAVSKISNKIFTSNFDINDKQGIVIFSEKELMITDPLSVGQMKRLKRYPMKPNFQLDKIKEFTPKIKGKAYHISRVQGGALIGKDRILVLVSDSHKQPGLHFIDVQTGERILFHPIHIKKNFPYFEELEGISFISDSSDEYKQINTPLERNLKGKLKVLKLSHGAFKDKAEIITVDILYN